MHAHPYTHLLSAETKQPCRKRKKKNTLTCLCKEGEDAAWSGQLFVAGRQEQSKVEQKQKQKRALPRTSHISDQQTRSSAEELWAAGLDHGQPLQRSALTRGSAEPGGPADADSPFVGGRTAALCRKEGRRDFPPVSTFLARRSAAGSED